MGWNTGLNSLQICAKPLWILQRGHNTVGRAINIGSNIPNNGYNNDPDREIEGVSAGIDSPNNGQIDSDMDILIRTNRPL